MHFTLPSGLITAAVVLKVSSYLLASECWICQIRQVLFVFPEKHAKYDPARRQTAVSASQTDPFSSSLPHTRGWEKSRSPGRCAQAALDAEEGGRKAREGGGGKKMKRTIFFFLPPLVTKAVHIWVGPAGAISLKADFGEVSGLFSQ